MRSGREDVTAAAAAVIPIAVMNDIFSGDIIVIIRPRPRRTNRRRENGW